MIDIFNAVLYISIYIFLPLFNKVTNNFIDILYKSIPSKIDFCEQSEVIKRGNWIIAIRVVICLIE